MKYETQPGQHIREACKEAVILANEHNTNVEFEFNGITLYCNPKSSVELIYKAYEIEKNKRQQQYEQSDEYKEYKQKQNEELLKHQENIDYAMISFSNIFNDKNLDTIMSWLKEFTTHTDFVGVTYDKKYIADFFELNGFKENENVGILKEYFNNKENIGRYIIGQAINYLRKDMPPHPITLKFIDDYFAME